MMYNIFIGNIELYGIEEFSEASGREVVTHSTLGTGAVPIYGDKELRSWSISCELSNVKQFNCESFTPASDIFAAFEWLLASGEEQRLVVVSENNTLSEMALLKNYKRPEKDIGVYDVTIELLEYKKVSVRTADIPYIQRPGKIPAVPPVKPGNAAMSDKKEDINALVDMWTYLPYKSDAGKYPRQQPRLIEPEKFQTFQNGARGSIYGEFTGYILDSALGLTDSHTFQRVGKNNEEWFKRVGNAIHNFINPYEPW